MPLTNCLVKLGDLSKYKDGPVEETEINDYNKTKNDSQRNKKSV